MEKAILTIEDGKMPKTNKEKKKHEARLSEAERKILINYFEVVLKKTFKN